jgi:hypothetical protein
MQFKIQTDPRQTATVQIIAYRDFRDGKIVRKQIGKLTATDDGDLVFVPADAKKDKDFALRPGELVEIQDYIQKEKAARKYLSIESDAAAIIRAAEVVAESLKSGNARVVSEAQLDPLKKESAELPASWPKETKAALKKLMTQLEKL